MAETKNLARVILRSDGSVHIAFWDVRTIYATAENLMALFSDPIEFIETQSSLYKESTSEINHKRVPLENVLGLTLATVNTDKQIICDFPELFQYLFAASAEKSQLTKPLDMKSFELETVLSDEKSFLLRYYLEFTSYFKSSPSIKKNIKLRDAIQFEILREILNSFFDEELPKVTEAIALSEKLEQIETNHILNRTPQVPDGEMLTCQEYAKLIGMTTQTVLTYINAGKLKSAKKNQNGRWMINRTDIPEGWNLRKGKKRKHTVEGQFYRRKKTGSAADVEEHIKKLELFSVEVAPYIHTFEECDYYTKRHYHEVRFDGKAALIIDINPDYISTTTGESNRERILAGKAPVVPDPLKDDAEFHVHHVGQHSSSPFAIIPAYDHNGSGFSAFFHQGTPNKELHGPEFEAEKKNFWRNYLEEYDKAGTFVKIPYLNPKSAKYKK